MMDRIALRNLANAAARRTLGRLPLRFWEAAFPKDLIALCYHMVSDEDLPHFQLFNYKSAGQFETDVTFARERTLTYRMLVQHRLHNAPIPRNSVLFTFDDGFAECFEVIRPILIKHGVDGVFFVTTDFLDDESMFLECTISRCINTVRNLSDEEVGALLRAAGIDAAALEADTLRFQRSMHRIAALRFRTDGHPARGTLYQWLLGFGTDDVAQLERACALLGVAAGGDSEHNIFMSRAQVRQLAADGFTIGAHGLNHRPLEYRTRDDIEHEIVASCEAVRAITGQARVPFAFPHSGLQIDREIIADILARNPLVELIFDSGCLRRDPAFIVNRVFADEPSPTAATNVPTTLRDAWSVPSAWFRAG
jgi:peptidoglycan/xylan/chitin deacetylase (PgdA/CDA1 family)